MTSDQRDSQILLNWIAKLKERNIIRFDSDVFRAIGDKK